MSLARLLLAGTLLLAAPASTVFAQSATARAAVRRVIDASNLKTTAAFNAGRPREWAQAYAVNAVMMSPNAKASEGRAAIADSWQGAWDAGFRNVVVTATDVIVRGDLAVESGTYSGDIQPKTAGAPMAHDTGKYVVVWQRNNHGKWMILRDIYNSDMPAQ